MTSFWCFHCSTDSAWRWKPNPNFSIRKTCVCLFLGKYTPYASLHATNKWAENESKMERTFTHTHSSYKTISWTNLFSARIQVLFCHAFCHLILFCWSHIPNMKFSYMCRDNGRRLLLVLHFCSVSFAYLWLRSVSYFHLISVSKLDNQPKLPNVHLFTIKVTTFVANQTLFVPHIAGAS